jgi:hypothetical protein
MSYRTCPKCGAEETDRDDGENGRIWYACGTSVHSTIAEDIDQTYECQDAQVEILQNQIDVLTARAERAEALAFACECYRLSLQAPVSPAGEKEVPNANA